MDGRSVIKYACSYEGIPQGSGSKKYIVYADIDIPDAEWCPIAFGKQAEYWSEVKKEIAGWPED